MKAFIRKTSISVHSLTCTFNLILQPSTNELSSISFLQLWCRRPSRRRRRLDSLKLCCFLMKCWREISAFAQATISRWPIWHFVWQFHRSMHSSLICGLTFVSKSGSSSAGMSWFLLDMTWVHSTMNYALIYVLFCWTTYMFNIKNANLMLCFLLTFRK